MDGIIASAVVLPEQDSDYPEPTASSPGGQKRRQSSISGQDSKRQRLNSIDANSNLDRRPSVNGKGPTAPVTGRREKGRERRLFGAALGALSQNSATTAQRKRTEIEKRQKAQRQQEEQESDQRKSERETQRKAQRQKEQKRFEKESMRIRHANLRNMAYFLQTHAEPRLYYKPWEMSEDDEDRIRDQIDDAEDTIRGELDEYEAREKEDGEEERERHASRHADAERDAGATPIGKDQNAHAPELPPPTNETTNDSELAPKDREQMEDHAEGLAKTEAVSEEQATKPEQHDIPPSQEATADEASREVLDDNGEDEMVEAAEDTVIY